MKMVLDSTIIISALLFGGNPGKIFKLCIYSHEFTGCISPELLAELLSKLKYKFEVNQTESDIIKEMIISSFEYTLVSGKVNICRESMNNMVLELAVSCKADYIITGDRDLLDLKKINDTNIITPAKFFQIHKEQ
jgi:putative PIN family toxin of toxin-antitoxin system